MTHWVQGLSPLARAVGAALIAISAGTGSVAGWSARGLAEEKVAQVLEARILKLETQVSSIIRDVAEIKRLLIDMNCQDLGLTQPQCLAEHLRRGG